MKNDKGSSTIKFFLEWLVEEVKNHLKAVVVITLTTALSFAANSEFPELFNSTKSPNPLTKVESPLEDKSLTGQDVARAPSSLGEVIPEESNASNSVTSSEPAVSSESPPNNLSPPSGNIKPNFSNAGGSPNKNYTESFPDQSASQANASSNSKSSKALEATPDNVGMGGFATPTPSPASAGGQASNSGTYNPAAGRLASSFPFSSKFQIDSGGQTCSGPQMQARVSIGTVLNPGYQTGTGILFVSGMEGILYGH